MNYEGYSIVDLSANPQVAINTANIATNTANIAINAAAIAANSLDIAVIAPRWGLFGCNIKGSGTTEVQGQFANADKTGAIMAVYGVGCGELAPSTQESYYARSSLPSFAWSNGTGSTPYKLRYTMPTPGLATNDFVIRWAASIIVSGFAGIETGTLQMFVRVEAFAPTGPALYTSDVGTCSAAINISDGTLETKQIIPFSVDLSVYPTATQLHFTPSVQLVSGAAGALALGTLGSRDGTPSNSLEIEALYAY